jgi:hypothetical protein
MGGIVAFARLRYEKIPFDKLFDNDTKMHCSGTISTGTFELDDHCPYTVILVPPEKLMLLPEIPADLCTIGISPRKATGNLCSSSIPSPQ